MPPPMPPEPTDRRAVGKSFPIRPCRALRQSWARMKTLFRWPTGASWTAIWALPPTLDCRLTTSGLDSRKASIWTAALLAWESVVPEGKRTDTLAVPESLWGTKLIGIRGTIRIAIAARPATAAIRTALLCLSVLPRVLA